MSIKLEHVVLASTEQMEFIIEGMRNPMNSWDKSDSKYNDLDEYKLGYADKDLMRRLVMAGTDHRKFMRMIPVYVRVTAPLYWWKEFETYKVGTVSNSCSTMHKIAEKEFTIEDFSCEHLVSGWIGTDRNGNHVALPGPLEKLESTIELLNNIRNKYLYVLKTPSDNIDWSCTPTLNPKDIWWQIIQLLPSSYNQTRNVMMNYEVLANIYKPRKDHKLDEWREFCKWIETLPYSELITGKSDIL